MPAKTVPVCNKRVNSLMMKELEQMRNNSKAFGVFHNETYQMTWNAYIFATNYSKCMFIDELWED